MDTASPRPLDPDRLEARVQEIGRSLLADSLAAQPTIVSPEWWGQQANELATSDDELKVRLFRLVDCMPMLDDPAAIDRHLREYIDDDVIARLPTALRLALQAARTGVLAPLAARAVRAATLAQARRFIAGTTPAEAARAAERERASQRGFTLDLLGEAVTSEAEADAYAAAYARLLTDLPPTAAAWRPDPLIDDGPDGPLPRVNVSIKLSALDSQFDAIDPRGTTERVLSRLRPLWRLARDQAAQVHVDMESHATKDLTLAIFKSIAMEDEFRDWPHCGIVVQCYLRESARDLDELADWARRRGTPVWIRLVKGAYWDYETIHARAAGWPIPVWQHKWETDACFEQCTRFVIERAAWLRPAIGSHNLRSLAAAMAAAEAAGLDRRAIEMQMLYGMGDAEKVAVTKAGWRMRVYMPYGQLVPGMAYLVRRLLENSSNDSFLRAGFVKHVAAEQLLAPPRPPARPSATRIEETRMTTPSSSSPREAFHNEPLTDFAIEVNRRAMQDAVDRARGRFDAGPPLVVPVVIDGKATETAQRMQRRDPSDHGRIIADVSAASAADAGRAVDVAAAALPAWRGLGFHRRAEILRKAAAIMRARRFDLAAIQVFEVGKPWREADADVAEAIDFCEYYAREAEALSVPRRVDVPGEENATTYAPRGVAVVIAPWNFPLAILAGMSAAALVTGNTVVLKPAEQSSLVAWRWHEILLEAGVPPAAAAFLPARGEEVGPTLVAHPQTALVAFTGSRAVGLAINQLAAASTGRSIKRVIAELGGKNAIIVDDDADLDEAVVATVTSSCGFQGQKCSACSRVIVLDHVHDAFVERLAEAVKSLKVGPAAEPGSRVGPLVDEEARDRVRSFIDIGRNTAREVVTMDVGPLADRGWFVGPCVFADADPAGPLGQEEIFGPVVAVFRARDFEDAIRLANGTSYALTAGVFSRSPAHLARAREAIEAGNLYLNRGITGALVNRQPFGGYRMSGIGSKAGGPDYLLQFVVPRTVTENTMRRGFAPES